MGHQVDRAERRQVNLRGYALNATRDLDILVSNLSYTGCQIRCEDVLTPGEIVELRVVKRGAIQAEIRWSDEQRAGALFLN
jgi:hypothetical protein